MTNTTKRLLACGAVAGPLFVATAMVQALTRRGFDLSHQAASQLSTGSSGWIQIANFLITGALSVAYATGVRRALRGRPGGIWAPRLLYVYAGGLIVGGVFHPDAGNGLPPGTPAGQSVVRTWHGALHMISGSLAFLALIAVCFMLAPSYAASGQRRSAIASRVVGGMFAICLAASGAPHGPLTLFVGAAIAMLWIAVTAARLTGELRTAERSDIAVVRYQQPARLPVGLRTRSSQGSWRKCARNTLVRPRFLPDCCLSFPSSSARSPCTRLAGPQSSISSVLDTTYLERVALKQLIVEVGACPRRLLERVIQPRLLQLCRLVIGEAARFPELGRTFYERGLGRTIDDLAVAFEQLAGRGELDLDNDPRLAASQFSWLIMSAPINQAMLLGHDEPLRPAEIDGHAEGAVQAFLAAYHKR